MVFCGARKVAFGAVNGKSVMLRWAEDSSYGVIPQGNPTCVQCGLGRSTSLPELSSGNKKNPSVGSKNICSAYFDTKPPSPLRNKAVAIWCIYWGAVKNNRTDVFLRV